MPLQKTPPPLTTPQIFSIFTSQMLPQTQKTPFLRPCYAGSAAYPVSKPKPAAQTPDLQAARYNMATTTITIAMSQSLHQSQSPFAACNHLYGRLYDWSTAMDLPSSCNESSCSGQIQSKHRGICPSGWHIPSDDNSGGNFGYVGDGGNWWSASESEGERGSYYAYRQVMYYYRSIVDWDSNRKSYLLSVRCVKD